MWEAELQDMVEVYEPGSCWMEAATRPATFASHERRRRRERFSLEGTG